MKCRLAVLLLGLLWFSEAHGLDADAWERFKNEYIAQDGRVIDFNQEGRSHSEGQGYAMLLAVAVDDPAALRRCWKWAKDNLQVRGTDRLFAWSWGERVPGRWGVVDMNNATDGDLLIAAALLQGAARWQDGSLQVEALGILESVRSNLIPEEHGLLILLPGYFGFVQKDGYVLNPSYLVFPAFRLFARHEHGPFWERLHRDSLEVLARSTFTRLGLPADWVLWREPDPVLAPGRGPHYGYEAVRVLLYLAWDENVQALPGIPRMLDLIESLGYVPRSVDLAGRSLSLEDSPAGFYAVYARAADALDRQQQGRALWKQARARLAGEDKDYYSHVLYLLAQIPFRR